MCKVDQLFNLLLGAPIGENVGRAPPPDEMQCLQSIATCLLCNPSDAQTMALVRKAIVGAFNVIGSAVI